MERTLVTNLSTFELALVVITMYMVPGLVGISAVRRLGATRTRGLTNDVTGVVITLMAAVYGVMLAFGVIALYQQNRDAAGDVHAESAALSNLQRSSLELAPPSSALLQRQVKLYVDLVTGPEWQAMKKGGSTPAAWDAVARMDRILGSNKPRTVAQRVYLERAVAGVSTLVETRRERIHDSGARLPTAFLVLLFGGGYLLLLFTLMVDLEDPIYHTLVVVAVSILIGFSLTLCLSLEFPFSGSEAVSNQPFHEGALQGL